MKPFCKFAFAALALAGATVFVTTAAVRAQDKPSKPAEGGLGFDPAMMARMMELATPGKEHQELAKQVGKWTHTFKFRMSPDMPWAEGKGTSEKKTILGGRYIAEEMSSEMMGMPMQSMSLLGYDKLEGEYISMWADTMSTWWVESRGKPAADGTIEFKGQMIDVAGERPFRMVVKHNADGSEFVEMYDTIPPTGEVKVMEITSKRQG